MTGLKIILLVSILSGDRKNGSRMKVTAMQGIYIVRDERRQICSFERQNQSYLQSEKEKEDHGNTRGIGWRVLTGSKWKAKTASQKITDVNKSLSTNMICFLYFVRQSDP